MAPFLATYELFKFQDPNIRIQHPQISIRENVQLNLEWLNFSAPYELFKFQDPNIRIQHHQISVSGNF